QVQLKRPEGRRVRQKGSSMRRKQIVRMIILIVLIVSADAQTHTAPLSANSSAPSAPIGQRVAPIPPSRRSGPQPAGPSPFTFLLFPPVLYDPVTIGTAITAGDVNGDGKTDLVVFGNSNAYSSVPQVSVLLGNGDGTFQPAVTYSS